MEAQFRRQDAATRVTSRRRAHRRGSLHAV